MPLRPDPGSPGDGDSYRARVARLWTRLDELGQLAVAFSGGVDSTVLLHAARARLGEKAVAVLADSPSLPRAELAAARACARELGARLIELSTDELHDSAYARNDALRCYVCKRTLFDAMGAWARREGVRRLGFGEIADDLLDDRPGARAAHEGGVVAPLREAGFGKQDVRRYAREHGLAVADKPASACLASRIPRGVPVTRERLARVERAEELVRSRGFRVLRVRDHDPVARLELGPDELERGRRDQPAIAAALASVGFERVELAAYRTPGAVGAATSA